MIYTRKPVIHLIGLALKKKTINAKGQSAIDCGNHWQEFEKRNVSVRVSHRLNDEIFAVYYDYEGDHTKPYSYFIGCAVNPDAETPAGLDKLVIPEGTYQKIVSKGKMPDCVAASWFKIWDSDFPRAYSCDFEVYDQRSRDWQDAEVDIFLSVRQ